MLLLSTVDFFFKINFFRNSFRETVSDCQTVFVGHGLGPNCLQWLSADDKFITCEERGSG